MTVGDDTADAAGGEPSEDGEEEASEETTEEEGDGFGETEAEGSKPEVPEEPDEEITPVVIVVPEDTEGLAPGTEVEETPEAPGDFEEDEQEETVPEAPGETSPGVVTGPGADVEIPEEGSPESPEELLPEEDGEVSEDSVQVAPAEGPQGKDVGVSTEEAGEMKTEAPADDTTQRSTTSAVTPVEVTTKYVVEYNNGNFPELTERPHDVDDNRLGNNGFSFEDEEENSFGNEIDDTLLRPPRPLRDQVVELSIKLRGETYNDALRDPSSFHYQQLARHFTHKVAELDFMVSPWCGRWVEIEDAFERLPGFKGVDIIEFRPQKDLERGLVVLVHYAITVEVDSGGLANDTLDFISLQNNLVEKNYPGAAEQPTVVYTITDFRNYITEALHKDNFMTNSSLEAQGELQLENAHNLLPPAKPTSRPVDATYDNMVSDAGL
ncbi:hypothetical protein INR49_008799 [Caranx melampygus]|nr:hypothetical protein INR49_008799 [Caranx melampygus]